MTRPWRVVAALAFGLLACDESAGPRGNRTGGLTVQVASAGTSAALDSGYVRVSGPSSKPVRKVVPGAGVTIDSLLPGAYTVTLEGFQGGNLAYYGQSAATVVVGQTATATIAFALVRLVFATQPANVGLGRAVSPVVRVNLVDGVGNLITSASARNAVSLGFGTNPSGASFTTAQTVTAVNGVATFSNLAVSEAGAGYTVVASSTPLVNVTSTAFNVTNKAVITHNLAAGSVSVIEMATNTKVGADITVGSSPYEDVAFTADGAFAYVPNNGSNNVTVINMATGAVTTTIPVGTGPRGIAFGVTPNGPRMYVPNNTSNDVSVINTTTNTLAATVPVGLYAIRAALTPDGSKAFVANFSAGTVSVIATATNTVTATITVGGGPQGVAINPAGTFAYVANSGGATVSVINIATNAVVATIPVGSFPVGIAVTPNGQSVYVANQGAGTVSVITTATNTVLTTITGTGGARNLAISPGGRFVYIPDYGQGVIVVSTTTNTAIDTVAVGPTASTVGIGIAPKP